MKAVIILENVPDTTTHDKLETIAIKVAMNFPTATVGQVRLIENTDKVKIE